METDIVKLQKIAAAVDKIRKARTNLLLSSPFFGQFSVLPVLRPTEDFDGFATDGKNLFFNPDFVLRQSFDDLKTRIAQTVIKPALKHHVRRGHRKHPLWNEASNLAANDVLKAFNFNLPEDLRYDFRFHNKCAESIYLTLAQEEMQKQPANGGGDGNGKQDEDGGAGGGGQKDKQQDKQQDKGQGEEGGGQQDDQGQGQQDQQDQQGKESLGNSVILDGEQQTEAEKRLEEAKWNAALKSAAAAARACGQGSAALDRFVEEAVHKQLPWKEILARFLTLPAKNRVDWTRPSKKMIPLGFYFATKGGKEMDDPVMITDTSGSVSAEDLKLVGGQAHTLVADMGCGLHMVYSDAAVKGYQYIESTVYPPNFKLAPKGGGGTDFRPAFEYIKEHNLYPPVALYLTDGACSRFPDKAPEYDVLWVLVAENRSFKPPFGEVIHIN